jgi:tRNA 2-thiocytidine biosynthesis protein TtcA
MSAVARDVQQDARTLQLEQNKLNKRLRRQVGQAIMDYNMIVEGDRVMVCLSGGKFYAI